MGVPGAIAREVRSHAAGGGRRDVHGAGAQRRRRARCRHRARSSGSTRTRPSPEARPCCGRVNRGLAILGDTLFMGTIDAHLIALDAQDRQADLWNVDGRRSRGRLRAHARAAGRQGQGDRRHGRRRVRHPRLHRRLRREDRQGGLALQHHSRPASPATKPGRAIRGSTAARSVWVTGSYDPELEPDLLGHRQSRARTGTATTAPATTSTAIPSSRSTPTPAS